MEQNARMKKRKEQLNIVMLGHKRIPSREGGVEIVVEELATRMAAAGHKVTCLNRRGHHVSGAQYDTDLLDEYKGVALKRVWTLDKKGLAAVTSSFFAAVWASFSRADVVHIHAEGPAFMCWIPKLFGKRVVVTVHGLNWQCQKWKNSFGAKYILAGEKMAVRFADSIIVLNRDTQQYFMDTYGRETVWIPNGVRRPQILEPVQIREKFGLEKQSYILFLGRIVPEKGVHYLIEAYRGISTDKKLVIAGGNSDSLDYMQSLKEMAGDDPNIVFTDFVQGPLLDELYSNAYLFVLPSDTEGMPLSLMEAMSYGNCCVVSDIPGCTEVVEDKAVVFQKGNVENLTKCLQMLCAEIQTVVNIKNAAREFICEKYNWDDVVEKTLELYQ